VYGFVSDLHASPIETTSDGDESQRFIAGLDNYITVHTGIATFRLPWAMGKMPGIGTEVRVIIEVDE
jgi:hypothetical protein